MDELHRLAELCGIQSSYFEISGQQRQAAPEVLVRVLQALGVALERPEDAPSALREYRHQRARRWVEPVSVAWDGAPVDVMVRLRADQTGGVLSCTLHLESGEVRDRTIAWDGLPSAGEENLEGVRYVMRRFTTPGSLPMGYHRLTFERGGEAAEMLLLSAPTRAFEPGQSGQDRSWGVFLPLYALSTERSWGAGDFTDLETLSDWIAGLGGGIIATLPLLASFLDEPFEPGPYSPASRLFWNEFYLDIERIPEFKRSRAAQTLLNSAAFRQELAQLRAAPLVDYHRQMRLKRGVLEELARSFFASPGDGAELFGKFVSSHPQAEDYACFRAVGERRRAPWPTWPVPLRDGSVRDGDYDLEAKRYHLYVQWHADQQLQALASKARSRGPGFYLDLPLGVNPDSYDVWRERALFATNIAAGAPPDPFFSSGQNWGFPPLHPERIREQGYCYVIAYLRHHLRLAGVLRIDHMMGFHRLFWIPHGVQARDGIYIQYPAEELYAVFSIESHRHRSLLVGEDLGTVPPEVRPAMARHNVRRMYVLQFEIRPHEQQEMVPVPTGCVASVNTHDTPPFAGWRQGLDIRDRRALGTFDESFAQWEEGSRRAQVEALIRALSAQGCLAGTAELRNVLKAALAYLSASSAQVVLANLEDLWLETEPQNLPGTWRERPNWRRRAGYSFETIRQNPEVIDLLREMNQILRQNRK